MSVQDATAALMRFQIHLQTTVNNTETYRHVSDSAEYISNVYIGFYAFVVNNVHN